MITKEQKNEIIKQLSKSNKDTGSCEVQIGILTKRIYQISEHLKKFRKDKHSQLGLVKLIGKRRSFFNYLRKHDGEGYQKVIKFVSKQHK